ncbi:MAG: bifunctional glutamate--cysteine ligase GshA/glutathione synthetase GshB [Lactobacillales bacterium]|jgi:glutamate--cysteine ligase|nr:bifunctional glutamate--cysteine ligase GshA/glutathione synthetase GshB [Lactobacillales bacterium]
MRKWQPVENQFKKNLLLKEALPFLLQARFGLEKESQRVDLKGNLATTDHPKALGNRGYHPYIQTDFSETQLEFISPVADSAREVVRFLEAFHDVAQRSMNEDEMIWPLSMPPVLPEREDNLIIAKLDKHEDVLYRRYLAHTYGKRKQMVSGIHYNFEFSHELIQAMYQNSISGGTLEEYKTEVYMKLARQYLRYRWLVTYLFGASPVAYANYFEAGASLEKPVRSIRNSSHGYTNKADVFASYRDLPSYMKHIHEMVEFGVLSEEKEYYSSVRLRGGKKVSDLPKTGIRYIELRNIDLNPFQRVGISEETIKFLHVFLLYLVWADEIEDADVAQELGKEYNNLVAMESPFEQTAMFEEGKRLFAELHEFLQLAGISEDYQKLVFAYEEKLYHPEETISAKMVELSQTEPDFATKFGLEYYEQGHARPFQLAGFTDMELSTQTLMFDAIQKGIELEILDENDQFLELKHGNHKEYVKNANMTSRDNQIVVLAMENKIVTKKLLEKAGFRVPSGYEFSSMEEALRSYPLFVGQTIVVKPKSTNYGLGISIFKEGASEEAYQSALNIAFSEDSDVLVEEFLPGTEYRFFVLDGKVRAILLRVPANVVGDGHSTIQELVEIKNQDPLRGPHHRYPLEWIGLGELEQLMLKGQGYTVQSVPAKDEVVYLRENSNISTGGDSIDVTDDFDESYKKIAAEAVSSLGAEICGIDLIIPDKNIQAMKNSKTYGIIEANYNPAMHMHVYPYAGKGRRLTKYVLQLLFPEVFENEKTI